MSKIYKNLLGVDVLVYKTRKCRLRNYHPMARSLIVKTNFIQKHIQVLIKYLGRYTWININRKDLLNGN